MCFIVNVAAELARSSMKVFTYKFLISEYFSLYLNSSKNRM